MKITSFYLSNKKNKNRFNDGNRYISLCIYFFIATFLIFAKSNFSIMSSITNTYLTIIIPSLFSFILFNNILINSNYYSYISNSRLVYILAKIFKTNIYGATSIIIGYTMGFPNSARYLNEIYLKNQISKLEAQKLMLFVNNSSPIFILSAVGIGMFSNIYVGIVLLVSCTLSSLIIAVISNLFEYRNNKSTTYINIDTISIKTSLTFSTITKSILDTFVSLAYIYGFMAIFTIASSNIILILNIKNNIITSLLNSVSEISMRSKINITTEYSFEFIDMSS